MVSNDAPNFCAGVCSVSWRMWKKIGARGETDCQTSRGKSSKVDDLINRHCVAWLCNPTRQLYVLYFWTPASPSHACLYHLLGKNAKEDHSGDAAWGVPVDDLARAKYPKTLAAIPVNTSSVTDTLFGNGNGSINGMAF